MPPTPDQFSCRTSPSNSGTITLVPSWRPAGPNTSHRPTQKSNSCVGSGLSPMRRTLGPAADSRSNVRSDPAWYACAPRTTPGPGALDGGIIGIPLDTDDVVVFEIDRLESLWSSRAASYHWSNGLPPQVYVDSIRGR